MSTAGRINKSSTKFVPKRKNASSSTFNRAASTTPSTSGTPRVAAQAGHALPPTAEEEFSLEGAQSGEASGSNTARVEDDRFLVPPAPSTRAQKIPVIPAKKLAPTPIAPGSSFGPSDPTASQGSSQSHSQPPSSLGLSFGHRDPSSSQPASQFTQPTQLSTQDEPRSSQDPSSSPRRSPGKKTKGTAFGVSATAPRIASPPPPPAPSASASQAAPAVQNPLDKNEAAPAVAEPVDLYGNSSPEPEARTQREIEEEAKQAKLKKKQAKAEASAAKKEQKRLAKEAKARAKAKGKGKAVDQDDVDEEEAEEDDEPVVAKKSRAKRKAPELATDEEVDELATPREEPVQPKRAKRKPRKAKLSAAVVDDEDDQEEVDELATPREEPVQPKKPRASTSKTKGTGKRQARTTDDEFEADHQAEEQPTSGEDAEDDGTRPKKKRKAPAKPRAPRKKKKVTGEDDSESDDEVDAITKRRRRQKARAGPKKMSQFDRELFGTGKENEQHSDPHDSGDGSGSGSGSDDAGEGGKKKKKARNYLHHKGRAHRKIVTEIEVDPATTTMAEIATGRDTIGGRTSERGRELANKAIKAKADRRERTAKMKRHAKRRRDGIPSDTDPEDRDAEEDNAESAIAKAAKEGTADQQRGRTASATPAGATPGPAPRDSSPAVGASSPAAPNRMDALFRLGSEVPSEAAVEDEDDDDGKKADGDGGDNDDEEEDEGEDYGGLVETQYAPQMRIVDGQLVLDESSLEVDRALDANMGHVGPREVVEESARDRMVNSASWGKRKPSKKWTVEDTEIFFDGVRQFGTDFEMIAGLFPHRTRREIKAKWTKEDKINPAGITAALMSKKAINLEHYAAITGQDLSGPVPDDPLEAINKRRALEEAEERANGGPDRYLPKGKRGNRSDDEDGVGDDVAGALKTVEEEDDGAEDEEEEEGQAALERFEREEAEAAALDAEIEAGLA